MRTRVSLHCSQEVPARALRMLRSGEARETRDDMWGEKVNLGSNVTPKMRGFSAKGKGEELRGLGLVGV